MIQKEYIEKFDKIHNYKWMNNKVMSESMEEYYNYLTDRIEQADKEGMISCANDAARERQTMACNFVNGLC